MVKRLLESPTQWGPLWMLDNRPPLISHPTPDLSLELSQISSSDALSLRDRLVGDKTLNTKLSARL